ncbi:hypothetical protein ACWHY4_04765 [Pseudomonas sp. E2-15]
MTSVNTRPAPYTVGYEEPQKNPAPIRYQDSANASGQYGTPADSAPPRAPMTPEQRGPFSSRNRIVHSQQSQGAGSAGQLAALTQKNNELRAKLQGFSAEVRPQIQNLQKQVVDLTQQLNTPDKATQGTSNEPGGTLQNRSAGEQGVAPSNDLPSTQDASGTEPGQGQSLEELNREIKEFRKDILSLFGELKTAIQQLQEQIQTLTQRIDTLGTAQTPPPSGPQDTVEADSSPQPLAATPDDAPSPATDDAPSPATDDASAPATDETQAPSNEPEASAPRGIEALMQENSQLQAGLDQMDVQFKAVVSQLQEQIKALSKKISEQK